MLRTAYHYSKGSHPWTPFKKPEIQKVLSFAYSKSSVMKKSHAQKVLFTKSSI